MIGTGTLEQAERRGRLADLYLSYSDGAVRLAYLLTGDRSLAEDLVQDAFVKLAGRFADLRDPGASEAYLRKTYPKSRSRELDPRYLAVAVGDRIPVSSGRDAAMPEFMDVHRSMKGVTPEQLLEAHNADLAIQGEESVDFKHAWADPASGMVFCLSEGPNEDAVRRIHERAGHPADEIYEVSVQA
jgi:hypothetical protein